MELALVWAEDQRWAGSVLRRRHNMWIVLIALERPYTFIVLALLILMLSPVVILNTPLGADPAFLFALAGAAGKLGVPDPPWNRRSGR